MATKPTPGGSAGTYGTELNAFLDVSLDTNGKIINEALQTASTAPTADAALANKKYVDDQNYNTEGGVRNIDVAGSKTVVYTKFLTGTLDADSATSVAHGITGIDKILSVVTYAYDDNSSVYRDGGYAEAGVSAKSYWMSFDGTNVNFELVGSYFQSNNYRIKIDYIL